MKVLLLAGTAEARALAARLAADPRFEARASLAGTTRRPTPLPLPTRIGGFGGAPGLRRFLRAGRIDAVVDATHPFAAVMPARVAMVCAEEGLAHIRLLRPGFTPQTGDNWCYIDTPEEAAAHVPPAARVFLAIGPGSLAGFKALAGRALFCRTIDPQGAFPIRGGQWLSGRPPFDAVSEEALFRALKIDILVAKDSGGASGRAKLDAARRLALPVLLLRRPPPPAGTHVETVESAFQTLESLI